MHNDDYGVKHIFFKSSLHMMSKYFQLIKNSIRYNGRSIPVKYRGSSSTEIAVSLQI